MLVQSHLFCYSVSFISYKFPFFSILRWRHWVTVLYLIMKFLKSCPLRLLRFMVGMQLLPMKLWRKKKKFRVERKLHLKLQKLQPQRVVSDLLRGRRHWFIGWKTWTEHGFPMRTMCCTRKHWGYMETSAEDPLNQVSTFIWL